MARRETVRIEELRLRVPGLGREEARRLGEEVARRLAESLPPTGKAARLGVLELRARVPRETSRDRLAEAIARAILEKLG